MTAKQTATVTHNHRIGQTNVYQMIIAPKKPVSECRPGQFLHIRCSHGTAPLLRRPISVLRFDGSFHIAYEVKGEGTMWLQERRTGDEIDYLGPLGNSFVVPPDANSIMVIGGGIGIFPLVHLMESLPQRVQAHACFGFQCADRVVFDRMEDNPAWFVHIATDDGSFGHAGMVTDLVFDKLQEEKPDVIYCCGPWPMMKTTAKMAAEADIRCFVSLEERMACGIGACLGCACKEKGHEKGTSYSHVCKDGPVFLAQDLVWEED